MASASIRFAQSMHLDVVAEGIESKGQLDELRRSSCTRGQGYYLWRPMDATAVHALLETVDGPVLPPVVVPRVLIVDDDEAIRTTVGRLLAKPGFESTEAATEQAALDLARQRSFDDGELALQVTDRSTAQATLRTAPDERRVVPDPGTTTMTTAPQVLLEPGDHVVQFYDSEDDLVVTVGDHLAEALRSGDTAIVVATAGHRNAFADVLAAAGVNVALARSSGRLLELDADDALQQFMVDGSPDGAAFDAVVGGVVRRAGEGGRRVRAFGEMVALLWDAGQVGAAIELEELWNRLGERLPFSLFCAYPNHLVAGDEHADSLASVCHLHSAIVASADPRVAAGGRS